MREILESRVVGNSETVGQVILNYLHGDSSIERQDAKKLLDGIGISVYRPQGGNGSSQMLFISAKTGNYPISSEIRIGATVGETY